MAARWGDLVKQARVTNVLLGAINEAKAGLSRWRSEGDRHRRPKRMGTKVRRERREGVLGAVLEPHESAHDGAVIKPSAKGEAMIGSSPLSSLGHSAERTGAQRTDHPDSTAHILPEGP